METSKLYLLYSNLFALTGSEDAHTCQHPCLCPVGPAPAFMLMGGGDTKTLFLRVHPLGLLRCGQEGRGWLILASTCGHMTCDLLFHPTILWENCPRPIEKGPTVSLYFTQTLALWMFTSFPPICSLQCVCMPFVPKPTQVCSLPLVPTPTQKY